MDEPDYMRLLSEEIVKDGEEEFIKKNLEGLKNIPLKYSDETMKNLIKQQKEVYRQAEAWLEDHP